MRLRAWREGLAGSMQKLIAGWAVLWGKSGGFLHLERSTESGDLLDQARSEVLSFNGWKLEIPWAGDSWFLVLLPPPVAILPHAGETFI